MLTKIRPSTCARSTDRSRAEPNASRAATTFLRSRPRSIAKWFHVPRRHDDHRHSVPRRHVGDDAQRAVAAGHADDVRARGDRIVRQPPQVLARLLHHGLDATRPAHGHEVDAFGGAVPAAWVDEQHGTPGRRDRTRGRHRTPLSVDPRSQEPEKAAENSRARAAVASTERWAVPISHRRAARRGRRGPPARRIALPPPGQAVAAASGFGDGAFLAVQNDDTLTYENLLTTMADALAALADAAVGRRRSGRTAS